MYLYIPDDFSIYKCLYNDLFLTLVLETGMLQNNYKIILLEKLNG